ncbi:hypothetical protein DPMN_041820 [Dreissena polymorpha]|uniref:DUF6729 domain-containing protein n=1 Tax=Dreissena polymorpha TaxID=45954 RepID=A0A9D4CZC5_DREPO|nr:hypothetical protein DPMN_041820 [Dreissena polymorpha]
MAQASVNRSRWKTTLPKADQQWIAKALFRWTSSGGVELVPEHLNQLWWYPPQPAVAVNSLPGVDRYFARPLFLWMPRKQWKVQLYCPHPGCDRQELASAGINQKVRQVVDIDGYYNLACDNLECMKCRRRVLSWSHSILSQLDIGHRVQFPCILTAKHACDRKIVLLLRNRGLGNSCSQIRKKVDEQHDEAWLNSNAHYLTDCSGFIDAAHSGLLVNRTISDPPERAALPRHRWFMQIYIQDVFQRLDEIKAGITSVFGRILKLDSTKKVVKKLAGRPAKTALWCSNVGNEHGQILTSVMTSSEGHGLTPMLVGIINRYTKAEIPSPEILYLDRDCCGASPLQQVLQASAWNCTVVRLDIWHFMRRIATGCSTDSHALYSTFMGMMSNCIFNWDEEDFNVLSCPRGMSLQHKTFITRVCLRLQDFSATSLKPSPICDLLKPKEVAAGSDSQSNGSALLQKRRLDNRTLSAKASANIQCDHCHANPTL